MISNAGNNVQAVATRVAKSCGAPASISWAISWVKLAASEPINQCAIFFWNSATPGENLSMITLMSNSGSQCLSVQRITRRIKR